MRPEHIAGIGASLQHLREASRASLLTEMYLILVNYLSTAEQTAFVKFYQEMLLGMDLQAREAGVQPKTIEDLAKFIDALNIDKVLKQICDTLIKLMEPPTSLEL